MSALNWTALVSRALPYYPTERSYAEAGGVGKPVVPGRYIKRWRDNEAAMLLQQRQQSSVSPWGAFVAAQGPMPERTYRIVARNTDGTLKLTPIESMPAYHTYSGTVINVYRENRMWFPGGVPYLETMSVPLDVAAELNFEGPTPEVPVPVEIRASTILVPTPDLRDVQVYLDYQDYLRASKPPFTSNAERLAAVDAIRKSGMSEDAQIAALLKILTSSPGNFQVI